MAANTWYLKNNEGYVVAKFEKEENHWGFVGKLFTCTSWDERNKPYEYNFHSSVICKWDATIIWFFDGANISSSNDNSYYLNAEGFEDFIATMAFVRKLASDYWEDYFKSREDNSTAEYSVKEYESDMANYILKNYEITEEE